MIKKNIHTSFLFWLFTFIFCFCSSAQADISLPGYQQLGDNDNDAVTYSQLREYPFYVSLTSAITVDSISLENVSGQESDSSLVFFMDGTKVATGAPGDTTAYLDTPLLLSAGMHTLSLRGSCYDDGNLSPCSENDPDFDFSIPDLPADFVDPVTILINADLNTPLESRSWQQDRVKITGNANASIDLHYKDDRLDILGSTNAGTVDLGAGNNIMRVGLDNNVPIYLGDGWNQLQINGSHNTGTITGSNQGDTVKIKGAAFAPLELNDGRNRVEIFQNLTSVLSMDSSRDQAYIHGNVSGTIDMGGGRDTLKIDGIISGNVSGGNGNDTLYVNTTEAEWNSGWQQYQVSSFENIIFTDAASIDENLDEDDFSFNNIILHTADSNEGTESIHYLQKHHPGDNDDSEDMSWWSSGDGYGDIADTTYPYYPDTAEGSFVSIPFSLQQPTSELIIDIYRLRSMDGSNPVYIDGNQAGTLFNGGDSVDLGSDPYSLSATGNWGAGTHTLTIESELVSWNDYDDFSWDQIIITPTLVSGIDHFEFVHDGQGLTCAAESIILKACADPACEQPFAGPVTLELPGSIEWLGTYQNVEFPESGSGIELKLQQTSAATVTLDILASNPAALSDTPVRCTNTSGGEPCEIVFNDTGIVIDGDYADTNIESAILSQIAAKPSNTGYNAADLRVRIIRTDTDTGACVAAVAGKTLPAFIQYRPVPGEGMADNQIQVHGESSTLLTHENTPQGFNLLFDGNGTAPLNISSADCGLYTLQINLDIPVVDEEGNETASTVPGEDSSNPFIVRPLAVFVDAPDNPKAQNAAGAAYKKAGEACNLNFKVLAWDAGRDTDNNGTWDSAPSAALEDPGSAYTRTPSWNLGQPQVNVILPNTNGTLHFTENVSLAHGATISNEEARFDEVGIIQFNNIPLEFMGEQVLLNSPYVGRFIPHHFELTQGQLTNRVESSCTPASNFTYLGENLEFTYELTAKNASGDTTENYIDPFHKFSGDDEETPFSGEVYTIDAIDDPNNSADLLSDRVQIDALQRSNGWESGMAEFTVRLNVAREDGPGGPFDDVRFGIYVKDDDGVEIDAPDLDMDGDSIVETTQPAPATQLRYGRVRLENAHGSELLSLGMPFYAEYFDGNAFIRNAADSCTAFDLTHFNFTNDTASNGSPILSQQITAGEGMLSWNNPPYSPGSIDVELDLGITGSDNPWLQYDWNGDGTYDENPTSRATFGIFKGNEHIIYLRETTWRR